MAEQAWEFLEINGWERERWRVYFTTDAQTGPLVEELAALIGNAPWKSYPRGQTVVADSRYRLTKVDALPSTLHDDDSTTYFAPQQVLSLDREVLDAVLADMRSVPTDDGRLYKLGLFVHRRGGPLPQSDTRPEGAM